ncbi:MULTISPECIES: riboflavin synthase [Clostridium]|uniref:riboflavin synthase n=1 Tax=Clostridium TaxID=1485 RepID=UPI0004DAAAC2|nr:MULTISPECIES: riboflavin synthase [Clostridium]KEH89165.1 riboflavin synthase subunit alpha [Clostridium novyi A str. 4540]KEH94076.1 riboflavin synthase subunit alpha [Clostridium botulinum C/D str. It1]KEH95361.1 riboflavin synthase subunit alpha [Clostridium novyi A str. GD211209]
MFTGIVEEIGTINSIFQNRENARIKIDANKVLEDVNLGDSICTNGVCLTVTEYDSKSFTVDVMGETLRRSNLGELKKGDKVNLERALALGGRFGGHIVSGHIDGVGVIKEFSNEGNAIWISIETSNDILKSIVFKGSITIDGVSLTVAYVDDYIFKVCIIPHTQSETILTSKKTGNKVNLECDVIAKYIEKLLMVQEKKKTIDIDFLKENGFF